MLLILELFCQRIDLRITKMASFSFGFSGDDIDEAEHSPQASQAPSAPALQASAFPVQGKPQLPPEQNELSRMLAQLPSKIAYGILDVTMKDGRVIRLPRRELWDVRVQLMAEEEEGTAGVSEGLGKHDIKTGVYEGGFKSWESSVDLIKELAEGRHVVSDESLRPVRVIEVGHEPLKSDLAILRRLAS
jgi:protein-histidine N-methyltransferase